MGNHYNEMNVALDITVKIFDISSEHQEQTDMRDVFKIHHSWDF